MIKYKFPQFEMEIENPIISIINKSMKNIDSNEIELNITLETETAKKGLTLENVPCENIYDADFMALTSIALEPFEVK